MILYEKHMENRMELCYDSDVPLKAKALGMMMIEAESRMKV